MNYENQLEKISQQIDELTSQLNGDEIHDAPIHQERRKLTNKLIRLEQKWLAEF